MQSVILSFIMENPSISDRLKFGLLTEIKSCNNRIGQTLRKKYRREMDYVYALINEMERKLERPIRDLDDVRLVMDMLKKIREQEIDMELKIEPIEVILRSTFFSLDVITYLLCQL